MNLIDKDALVAEIERRLDDHKDEYKRSGDIYASVLIEEVEDILSFINTLEVKEVDLEKELESWRHNHFNGKRDKEAVGEYLKRVSQLDLAKHFFALGLKSKQG